MIEFYKSLPDYIQVNKLERLFLDFLENVKKNKYDINEALESLVELADRQWHTYEILNQDIKKKVEEWLISLIDTDSLDVIENMSLIIGRLGLADLYFALLKKLNDRLNPNVRNVIIEMEEELKGNVADPYSGMK